MNSAVSASAQDARFPMLDRVLQDSLTSGPAWLVEGRSNALSRFKQAPLGFGKYSRLKLDWSGFPATSALVSKPFLDADDFSRGAFAPPNGLAKPLTGCLEKEESAIRALLAPMNAWDDLVLAGWREGLFIRLPSGDPTSPVPYLSLGNDGGLVLEPIIIDVPPCSDASLFLHWRGSESPSLQLSALRVRVGDGARLKLFHLHEGRETHYHLTADFSLGTDSSTEVYGAWMDGKWSVARFSARMEKPGASWRESHMVMATGRDHVEIDSQVVHLDHHTRSDVHVKTVAADSSRAIFSGNIRMEKESRMGQAYLADHVLLLSSQARADSVPGLEIKALEVKAGHAASVGQLDEDQLYYLESRGLDPAHARHLIVVGFLASLLERAPFPFVSEILNPELESKVVS